MTTFTGAALHKQNPEPMQSYQNPYRDAAVPRPTHRFAEVIMAMVLATLAVYLVS